MTGPKDDQSHFPTKVGSISRKTDTWGASGSSWALKKDLPEIERGLQFSEREMVRVWEFVSACEQVCVSECTSVCKNIN